MNADDLAPLLAAPGRPELDVHTGMVRSFDQATGNNVVEVAGTELTNLQMLNIGDTINLLAGDVVQVMRVRSNYFILGRVVSPNTPRFMSQTFRVETQRTHQEGFAITTTGVEYATQTFLAPGWANRLSLRCTVNVVGKNSRAVADYIFAAVMINGVTVGVQQPQNVPTLESGSASATHVVATDFTPPAEGYQFTVGGRIRANGGTWTADTVNAVTVNTDVTYMRT